MLLIVIGVFVITACQPEPLTRTDIENQKEQKLKQLIERKAKSARSADYVINKFVEYVIDSRTGVCFARSPTTHHRYVHSPVECTPKIMKLLINKKQ